MESTYESVRCTSCGSVVELPANFCDVCGTRLNSSDASEQPGPTGLQKPVTEPDENPFPEYVEGNLYHLKPDDIQTDPNQPMKYFDSAALTDLIDSIKDKSAARPILFRMDNEGNLIVVAGERKLQAAKKAELETIPAVFIDGNYDEIKLVENILCEELNEIALVETVLSEDLSAVDFGEALKRTSLERNYNHEQLRIIIGNKIPS